MKRFGLSIYCKLMGELIVGNIEDLKECLMLSKLGAGIWFIAVRASSSSRRLTKRPIIPDRITRGGEVITFEIFTNHFGLLFTKVHFFLSCTYIF